MKLYGSPLCPDCVDAVEVLDGAGIPYDYHNITESLADLKAFLALRDSRSEFDEAKESGLIGIPAFLMEDGSLTLDTDEAVSKAK